MECANQKPLGVMDECARDARPFWEVAEGHIPDGCFMQRIFGSDLNDREVTGWLVGSRHALERTRIEQGRLP